jgi:hypothetical protein
VRRYLRGRVLVADDRDRDVADPLASRPGVLLDLKVVNGEMLGSANAYESLVSSSPPSIRTVVEPLPVHFT